MLTRVPSFYEFLEIESDAVARARPIVESAARDAEGMTHAQDYHALAAVALFVRPTRIFEIGTYRGVTANFFLELLPESSVVSISFVRRRLKWFTPRYNNTDLQEHEIGAAVSPANRARYTQLLGDSHGLEAGKLSEEHGPFELVFIDGDHSAKGVEQDTELARRLIDPRRGAISWHDANPKEKYLPVREFLEQRLELPAVATRDDYTGGVACWSEDIAKRIAAAGRSAP